MKQINIRISQETYEQLKSTAVKDRRSMSSLAQVLIVEGLDRSTGNIPSELDKDKIEANLDWMLRVEREK